MPPHRVTSYDVACHAGVSQSAVSRCFTPGASISRAMRLRVEAAAAVLGYAPNALAGALSSGRSGVVAVVLTERTLVAFPELLVGLETALEADHRRLLLLGLRRENAFPERLPELLRQQVEGVIAGSSVDAATTEELRRRGVPVVLLNRAPPRGASAVCVDQAGAMRELTDRLIAAGHRRLAFLAGPPDAPASRERQSGFLAALRANRLLPVWQVDAGYMHDQALATMRSRLGAERLDAVVAANDTMALAAMDAARHDHGFQVPGDLSIVGFDDVAAAAWPSFQLTTVRQPLDRMAGLALTLLRELAAGALPRQVMLPAEIIVRNSARLARPSATRDLAPQKRAVGVA